MPNLAIKKMRVTMAPGQKRRELDAVVETETGDPLGFYSFTEEDGYQWHVVDSVYDYEIS